MVVISGKLKQETGSSQIQNCTQIIGEGGWLSIYSLGPTMMAEY